MARIAAPDLRGARKGDLDTPDAIAALVQQFYAKVLRHPGLRPFFNPAHLSRQMPVIEAYWERMLLGGARYRRNMVNAHREIHRRRRISSADFDSWLVSFVDTVDQCFAGPRAERAKFLARAIIGNLRRILPPDSPQTA
ncbi:MAG: group III truncated hemoglobin [Gammaproteobacteria bacterium]|nr:group III truncated hemoglobin [Gammaproteobacteria bacterium]